ncbi:MAG: hypothetical protein OXH31_08265 [Gammaproteobacteria bacterium]|nr:hypothetical protein [Gammaproteobacteria bacterium]
MNKPSIFLDSTHRILAAYKSEFLTTRRRMRFWILCASLFLLAFVGYLFSCIYLQGGTIYSPTFGIAAPRYLLGNISPYVVLVFQFGTLVLLLDSTQRNVRDRIDEVLRSKPVTSIEYLVGRVLSVSVLLWIATCLIVVALHGIGLTCDWTGWQFSEPFQTHSMLNLLLLDAPVSFVVWCSVIVLLTSVVRLRIGVFILGFVLMTGWSIVVAESPYSFLAILSASSNDSLFISEISPQFASLATMGARLASLAFAGALLVFAALFGQIDGLSVTFKNALGSGLLALSGVLYCSVAWGVVQHYYVDPAKWREVHESHTSDGSTDILDISGSVHINPKTSLFVDLELLVKTEATEKLTFTFNPAMKIQDLTLDDQHAKHSFRYGLLTVERGDSSNEEVIHRIRIVARGVPNPRFGYINAAIDYLSDPKAPTQAVELLGKDGSIYDKGYVALMAGVHWYPTAGSLGSAATKTRRGNDFFDVDLAIELIPNNWQLIGAGTNKKSESGKSSLYQVNPEFATSEINLFASQFERATLVAGGMTFNLHLHKKHTQNLQFWQEELLTTFQKHVELLLLQFTDFDLSLPTNTLNLVEVPDRLRTVGGGLRMKSLSSLPEIGLLKERGFPKVNIERLYSEQIPTQSFGFEEAQRDLHFLVFISYFNRALGTDNPFLGFAERYWSHHTSATGEFAEVLDEVVLALIAPSIDPFSIFSTLHVADLSLLMPSDITWFSKYSSVSRARLQEQYFGSRTAIWNSIERQGLYDLLNSDNRQKKLEPILLKARKIARGLKLINDEERLNSWLTDFRNQFTGNTYSLADLVESAKLNGIQIEPCLTSWLTGSDLPGYVVSPLAIAQLADDETGSPQFQTTVVVRNVQPVDGVIQLTYPTQSSAADLYWTHWIETAGIHIDSNSSTRINITTPYVLRQIQVVPGLSLDRKPFVIRTDSNIEDLRLFAPRPFLEDSDWFPITNEQIIVDDLDEDFSISQPDAGSKLYISVTPKNWFSRRALRIFEVDKGLAVYTDAFFNMPQEVWHRRLGAGSYGRHRKTTAIAWVPKLKPPGRVSFVAEVPNSATWTLEYHLPVEWNEAEDFSRLTYKLRIHDAENVWNLSFDTNSKEVTKGWNFVEELNLKAGTVTVQVLGTASPGLMFADAIRWTKVPDE